MLWSNGWDLLLKVLWLFAAPVLIVVLHIDEWPQKIGLTSGPVIGIIGVALWVLIYRQGLSAIASWLYARLSLGAPVSLREAYRLRHLFQTDLSFRWIPLKEVKQLPKAQRREAVVGALARVGPGRKAILF
ncbi:MAG TPA: hypothetical protein VEU74_06005 [Gemmatimonadales bacterium]|nr:hypothetical protein [Gemmatimonadales bacterium]